MKLVTESFTYVKESLLNESFNSKDAKKKFLETELISNQDFNVIKQGFLPKYVYWACREKVSNPNVILDSIYDITLWFEKSKQYLKSKDLYTYSYEQIRQQMNDPNIGPKKTKVKGQGMYEIIYEDDEGNIAVYVKDHTASVYWAHKYRKGEIADGQWCTASYTSDDNFKKYSKDGPIIIFIIVRDAERYCRVLSVGDSYNIEEISSKKKCYASTSVSQWEYYDSDDEQISSPEKSFPEKMVKSVNEFTPAVNSLTKSDFIFSAKDIPYIHVFYLDAGYFMYSHGPKQKEIKKFIYDNMINVKSKNISTLDKAYKFFYLITSIDSFVTIYGSKVDLSDNRYIINANVDDTPDFTNFVKCENLNYDQLLEYFNVSVNPMDSFDDDFIKKYNVKLDILSKKEKYNGVTYTYNISFGINGINERLLYSKDDYIDTTKTKEYIPSAEFIKTLVREFSGTVEISEKYKKELIKIQELGFEPVGDIWSRIDFNHYSNNKPERYYAIYFKNNKLKLTFKGYSNKFKIDFKIGHLLNTQNDGFDTMDSFLKFYKDNYDETKRYL